MAEPVKPERVTETNPRADRMKWRRKVLQYECCPPHRGENQYGRMARRARLDRYKNHRR